MKSTALKKTAAPVAHNDVECTGGFIFPPAGNPMPELEGPKALLSAASEVDLGFRILQGQLDLVRSLAVDTGIVESMVDEIWNALGEKNLVKKSVALVYHEGVWLRSGAPGLKDKEYADIVRKKLNSIRLLISELRSVSRFALDEDLFSSAVRDDLRKKLSEILPYDYILNRAADQFRSKCKGLKAQCKDLVKFIAEEVRLPYRKTDGIVSGNWTSPKLIPALLACGGYELKLFPPAVMRRLRQGIIARQKSIFETASTGEAPAAELLASWSTFTRFDRQIEQCVALFVKANMRMVEQMVYQYKFADLEVVRSAANMGLVRAVYRFAPEKGFKFSTIAVQWIQQSILRDLNEQEMIRLPEGSHRSLQALKAALKVNPSASIDCLLEMTGLERDDLNNLMYLVGIGKPVTLDTTYDESGSTKSNSLHEVLADQNNDFVSTVMNENSSSYLKDVLGDVLDSREMYVLEHRYGLGDVVDKTLGELSDMMGLSKERIRQIEVQAIKKIRSSEFADELQAIWE